MKADDVKFGADGLAPMVVQDADSGAVLSLFYANREAFERTGKTGFLWRYSREHGRVMKKGETSGNCMRVVSIHADCDSDALLVRVLPQGPACHTGAVSCFGSGSVGGVIGELAAVIAERRKNPADSYASRVVADRGLCVAKLREELEELIAAEGNANLSWEAADLLFFTLVYVENRGGKLSDVLGELRRRRK